MRPRRDPKRKPPSEQALREALRRDLPPDPDAARAPARQKPRKKRKRPAGRPTDAPRASRPEGRDDGRDEPSGADEGPDADDHSAAEAPDADLPSPSEDASPRHDPRVEDLEDKVKHLTEALEGMSSEKSELEGVAQKFKGMEDRMKGLLQLSEVLSVRYNPFLSNEEGDVFDGSRHDPSSLLPRDRPPRPSEVLRPAPAPVEDRFRGEVVRVGNDEPTPQEPAADEDEAPPEDPTAEDDLDAELEAALAPFHEEPEAGPDAADGDDGGEDDLEAHHDLGLEAPGADLDLDAPDAELADEGDAEGAEDWDDAPEPAQHLAPDADADAHTAAEPQTQPAPAEPLQGHPAAEAVEAARAPAPDPVPAPSTPPRPEQAPQHPHPPRPAVPHRPVPPALPARPAATAQPGPSPPYHAPGRSRESYLALCWFERLAREGDPSEIHLFVDHYAGLGWIPAEHHGWMAYLAESVAPRRPELTWADVEAPSHELARLHRRNLRFLDRLFRCGLGVDDPLRWDDEAQWWMEDG